MSIPQHVTDHRLLSATRARVLHRHAEATPSDVARQLWDLVARCVDGLETSAARGGPAPLDHLTELRWLLLRRDRHRSLHHRETVDTVIALLRAQLDPTSEPPIVPLVAGRTGRVDATATAVVRGLGLVDRALHAAA